MNEVNVSRLVTGDRQRTVHVLPGLVLVRVPGVRDDRGPGALPRAQREGQKGRGRSEGQGQYGYKSLKQLK